MRKNCLPSTVKNWIKKEKIKDMDQCKNIDDRIITDEVMITDEVFAETFV